MHYSIKEYKYVFDTPAKRQQELAIVSKIMFLLNNKAFSSLDDFMNKIKSYNMFLDQNKMSIVMKHFGSFGNELKEEDYQRILNQMKMLTLDKKSFSMENVRTANLLDEKYNVYTDKNGETTIMEDASKHNLNTQFERMQQENTKYQSANKDSNTKKMIKDFDKNIKESIKPIPLLSINKEDLTYLQNMVLHAAFDYELDHSEKLSIDFERGIVVDSKGNLYKLIYKNNEICLLNEKGDEIPFSRKEEMEIDRGHKQFVFTPNKQGSEV